MCPFLVGCHSAATSGNSVAIGDNLTKALTNLFSDDYSVDLEFINVEDIDALVDSVIKANNNLKESLDANDFEMIGKDISSLQTLINQLETARKNELEIEEEQKELLAENETENLNETTNTVSDTNTVKNETAANVATENVAAPVTNTVK